MESEAKIWVLFLVLQLLHGVAGTMVKLSSGGFEGIVVAIDPELPEDQRIIDSIKDMIREGSAYLFSATQQRFYFKSVKIIIPLTWTAKTDYKRLTAESYANMDVMVAKTFQNYVDEPYTLQDGNCGEKGQYIHFTSKFLTDDKLIDVYGPRGRVFVHEWAHLRWGVFDEYNYDAPFYATESNQVEATRCSTGITGRYIFRTGTRKTRLCKIDSQTGLYETGCLFVPEIKQNTSTSIMYIQSLPSVNKFCDKTNHNIQATNMQNKLCNYRSTWDVIMDSSDFASSTPMTDPPPTPIISLLQTQVRVVCLVLDVSKRMGLNNRINRVRQAAELFLVQVIEKDSWVGMVTFESTAEIVTSLQQIVSDSVRTSLANSLPTKAGGITNICSGLRAGFQVFLSKYESSEGCEIVLVTCGDDPEIISCFPEVERSGSKIHTIALGPSAAEELSTLADMTGGLKFSATDSLDSNDLIDAFSGLSSGSGSVFQRFFQLESKSQSIGVSQSLAGTVSIDKSVGIDTFFVVTWSTSIPTITLKEPKGKRYLQTNFVIDNTNRLARLEIAGTAMAGNWDYSIQNSHTSAQVLSMIITSRASSLNEPPVIAKPYLSRNTNPVIMFTKVTKGILRVINAKVIATIEAGSGSVTEIELFDDGAGADIYRHDGVYSRYFTSFKGNGPYNWKVFVQGEGKTVRLFHSQSRSYYVPGFVEADGTITMFPPRNVSNVNTENFTRTSGGNSFIVTGIPTAVDPTADLYPPCKIRDLDATLTNNGDNVLLSWTAPGDDLDSGTVDRYELRMSENIDHLRDFLKGTPVDTSPLKPSLAATREMFEFKPAKKITKTTFFAIRAFDKANQAGEVSNIVKVNPINLPFPSFTTSSTTTSSPATTTRNGTSHSPTGTTHSTSNTIGRTTHDMTTLVAIIVGLSAIALCCVGGSMLWFLRMQINLRRSPEVLHESIPSHTPTKRISVSSV